MTTAAELTLAELDAFASREALIDELVIRAAQSCSTSAPSWRWANGNRGNASAGTCTVTIPRWAGDDEEGSPHRAWHPGHRTLLFLAYYAVHEVAHLPLDSWGHDERFKQYERTALAELGVGIRYMRNYPATLYDLESGAELYVSDQEERRRDRLARRRSVQARMAELREHMPEAMDYELVALAEEAAGVTPR